MVNTQLISLSDLLRLSHPLTGAASIQTPTSPPPPPSKKHKPQPSDPDPTPVKPHLHLPNPRPNPRLFSPLPHPSLLIGTIDLHQDDSNRCIDGCKDHCFSFSDDSSTVCCSILDFDLGILGRTIHVLAWNFIPFKNKKGGVLEVIRWSLRADSGLVPDRGCLSCSYSVQDNNLIARSQVFGTLESVSPIFTVPCRNPGEGEDCVGFLAEIATCSCDFCSKARSLSDLTSAAWEQTGHSFTKPAFVYFLKPTTSWRPAVGKLVGRLVFIAGLKKKLICVGKDASYVMFVTTVKTVVSLGPLPVKVGSIQDGDSLRKGDGGMYSGLITGVYMQGMAVELDEKVWLLITDPAIAPQHSFRVGAIISVRNYHLVYPKFSWTRMLLLGTSVRTAIDVKSFSFSDTWYHARSQSQSKLGKFVQSLILSARFWVLLLVSCFRRKFANIFSDKEILGSKHQEGLAQIYASAYLPANLFQDQHGVFMEFCKQDQCTYSNTSNLTLFRLVVPISNLLSKCEAIFMLTTSKILNDAEMVERKNYASNLSSERTSYCHVIRRIISIEDLGCILMGRLKISSHGRLQLADATGNIDVVVPDLLSINFQNIYEVKNYKLIIEGLPAQQNSLEFLSNEALSCRNIFQHFPIKKVANMLTVYAYFYVSDATVLSVPFHTPSCNSRSDDLNGSTSEITHLLLVTHKFPASENVVLENFQNDPTISGSYSLFAEAIVLPYNLIIPEKHEFNQLSEVSFEKLRSHSDYPENQKNLEKKGWLKRSKVVESSKTITVTGLKNYLEEFERRPSDIPCLITYRSANCQESPLFGYLYYNGGTAFENVVDYQCGERILVEFKSDSFCKYELLQIGGYYIVKYSNTGLLCNTRHNKSMNRGKILVNSQTSLWSLSFSVGEIACQQKPLLVHSSGISQTVLGNTCQTDLKFREPLSQTFEASVVHLHLLIQGQTKEAAEDGLIRLLPKQMEVLTVSTCIQLMKAEVVKPYGTAYQQTYDLPHGKLISLHGIVEDVQIYNSSSKSQCEPEHYGHTDISEGRILNMLIHVHDEQHMVKIHGSFTKHAYPVGLGPGTTATFHRVLVTCSFSGRPKLVLMPVSFIVINSIKEADLQHTKRRSALDSKLNNLNKDSFDTISLGFISQLIQCNAAKAIRFHCWAVTVHFLVLENCIHDTGKSQSWSQPNMPMVKIPLAGFVLDDGSSICCCWADAYKAEVLLRLHETAKGTLYNNHGSSKRAWHRSFRDTVGFYLEKVLKKHHKVVVKSHGALSESSIVDFTFSVNSNEIFTSSEERLLKFIVLNSCGGSNLSIVGIVMDSDSVELLETELEGFQVAMPSMPNVWITEIGYVNPLKEARNMLHQLSSR